MNVNLEMEVLGDDALEEALDNLDAWEREGKAIKKTFVHDSFLEAIAFVNRVAVVAEERDHHPDFIIEYKNVTLRLWTHKYDAVTRADIELAKAVEKVDLTEY